MNETLNRLIPELYCEDIGASVEFYTRMLGFTVLYDRPEEGFAMLDHQGAQLMLDRVDRDSPRSWLAGPLERPFGRGINLQIETEDVARLYARLTKAAVPIFMKLEEKWYRAGAEETGLRQFIVQDPDGYLLRFCQKLGRRPHRVSSEGA